MGDYAGTSKERGAGDTCNSEIIDSAWEACCLLVAPASCNLDCCIVTALFSNAFSLLSSETLACRAAISSCLACRMICNMQRLRGQESG